MVDEGSKDSGMKESFQTSRRRVSDDVTSLDSWSELTTENKRGSDEIKSERTKEEELVLNPRRLCTIKEPPEPKIFSVNLEKSQVPKIHNGKYVQSSKFYRMIDTLPQALENENRNTGLPENAVKKKRKKKEKLPHTTSTQLCGNCSKSAEYSLETGPQSLESRYTDDYHQSDLCDCSHCLASTSGHKSLPILPTQEALYGDSRSSQSYLKKHASIPFLQSALSKRTNACDNDDGEIEQSEKVKNKIMSVWNNVRYGWTLKTKTNFEKDSPIFLLGRCYHIRPDVRLFKEQAELFYSLWRLNSTLDVDPEPGKLINTPPSIELFKRDFQSRLWFTYRRDFQALPQTKFTTDCGWGCMLRSSQMMLSQAFICHFLERDWRLHHQTKEQETYYRQIIQWFGDSVSDQCPFSVHRLVELGKMFGKQPGEWYGPSSVAHIIRDAVIKASFSQPVLKDLCVYVAQDCTVYKQDVIDMCTQRPRNLTTSTSDESDMQDDACSCQTSNTSSQNSLEWKRSVIILIPVRLGGEEYNPIYSPCIKNLMAQECCLGIIGGKPKHSLYFIGWQEEKLIYLDPHFCQDFVDTLKRDFKIESFHCFSPRKVSLSKMDPSATVGFYCRTKQDFEKFVEHTEQMVTPNKGSGLYPMFVFNEGKGSDMNINDLSLSVEKSVRVRHVTVDQNGKIRSSTVDSEEFVVL